MSAELEALIAEARDPSTPLDRLLKLMGYHEVEVRRALLANPNLCPTKADGKLNTGLMVNLAQEFPEEAAQHPAFILHALIEPNEDVKFVVMQVMERTKDVNLIEHVWSTWGSGSSGVRQSVARNPATPVDILRTLGNPETESEWNVRHAVASNPRTPVDLLRTLGNLKTESVWAVRWAVASNPSTPEDFLRTLGNPETESNPYVREAAQKALARRRLA